MQTFKFKVGQAVVFNGETVTVTGTTFSRKKGPYFSLSNGEIAKAKELTAANSGIEVGVIPETFQLPAPTSAEVVEDMAEEETPEVSL